MEAGSGSDEFDGLVGQLVEHRRGLQGQLDGLNQQIQDLQPSLARARQENERLNERIGRREATIQQANERVGRRDEEIRGLKREKEGMKEALQSRDETLSQLQGELDDIKARTQARTEPDPVFRRPRTIAGSFDVVLKQGDPDYVDMLDGHRHVGDVEARARIRAYGINYTEEHRGEDLCRHTWKYSSIANLPKELDQANEDLEEKSTRQQEESENTPRSPPQESGAEDFEAAIRTPIIPGNASGGAASEVDHRGTKRPASAGIEEDDNSSRNPICHQCFLADSVCSGAAHCAGCEAKEDCRYKRCWQGLSCRRARCGYVHSGQLEDESEHTIEEANKRFSTRAEDPRLRDSAARSARINRRGPACVRCWQVNHQCQQESKCGNCQVAGVKCIYKICNYASACKKKNCVYVHPGDCDSNDPAWNFEDGSLGRKGRP